MSPDVLAVADYLRDRIALYGEHTRAPGSECGRLVDGEPFWIAVARAAVALGARAERMPMHGPVRNLSESRWTLTTCTCTDCDIRARRVSRSGPPPPA